MSLLLDALKKAAEKNAQKEQADLNDSTRVDLTEAVEKTDIADGSKIAAVGSIAPSFEDDSAENITEMELAQIINAQKEKTSNIEESIEASLNEARQEAETTLDEEPLIASSSSQNDDETDLNIDGLSIDDIDPSISLALYPEDEDPSLKLALSDEEILLTDDDVTEFLGSDELVSRLSEDGTMTGERNFIDDDTELKLVDRTHTESLNLVDPPNESDNDTTYRRDKTSTTSMAGQTTNLNSLTNDVTVHGYDQTSTETFASDNYDRTLVKLDGDVSKVFTGMRSVDSGAAMTPDFAKKVFVHKSTTLRRRNYKIYSLISLILFATIGVLALFEMQSQMDSIDSSLVRLKKNPVPSELRFQRSEKKNDDLSVLQGRVDVEALNLLKSLRETVSNANTQDEVNKETTLVQEKKEVAPEINKSVVDADIAQAKEENVADSDANEKVLSEESQTVVTAAVNPEIKQPAEKPIALQSKRSATKVKTNQKQAKQATAKKTSIRIKTKISISKESIWLKDAYAAFEKGDIELATMNYARVLDKDPKNRDALLGQAAIYASQNKNNKAFDNYQAVLLENPKDSLAMTSLIAASTMSPIESESRLKLLHRESPNATYLQFALGNVIGAQNRWKEAQQFYFMAYQAEPKNPDYAYNLAVSLEHVNKPDIAVNYYEQAVKNAQTLFASFDVALIRQRIEVLSQ